MKRLNLPLLAGLLVLAIILFITAFPGTVSKQGPYVMQSLRSWVEDGRVNFRRAPFPPSEANPLGTDELGRDIWSRIARGSRLTLTLGTLIVLGRFIIALPVALAAGFGSPVAKSALRLGGLVFSAIPALLFAIIILQQQFFVSLDKAGSVAAFVIVLSGVGWAKLGLVLAEKTEDILRQPFILSERAIGKGPVRIALENVLPHLAPETVILFFMEMARALSMVMQLGIFSVFVGNIRVVASTDEGVIRYMDISFEPEWAGMLGTARARLSSSPWMVIWPALAFLVCVFSFNLIGEGLRRRFQAPDMRIRNGRNRVRRRVGMALVVVAVLVSVLVNRNAGPAPLEQSAASLAAQPIPGSGPGEDSSEPLIARMRDSGLTPLDGLEYRITYPMENTRYLVSSEMSAKSDTGELTAVEGRDYRILRAGENIPPMGMVGAGDRDLFSPDALSGLDGRVVLIDGTLYSDSGLSWILEEGMRRAGIGGSLIVSPDLNRKPVNRILSADDGGLLAEVTPGLAEGLRELGEPEISLTADIRDLSGTGWNLAGMLPGRDPVMAEEKVLVALSREEADLGIALIRRLAAGAGNRRTYLFMFLGGTTSDRYHGIRAFEDDLPFEAAEAVLYLDLSALCATGPDRLTVNTEQAPITRYYAWSVGYMLENALEDAGIPADREMMINRNGAFEYRDSEAADIMFWKHGIPSVRIAGGGAAEVLALVADILERNDI